MKSQIGYITYSVCIGTFSFGLLASTMAASYWDPHLQPPFSANRPSDFLSGRMAGKDGVAYVLGNPTGNQFGSEASVQKWSGCEWKVVAAFDKSSPTTDSPASVSAVFLHGNY